MFLFKMLLCLKDGHLLAWQVGKAWRQGRMARGGLGLPKVSLGPAMPYLSIPCGRPTLKPPCSCFRGGLEYRTPYVSAGRESEVAQCSQVGRVRRARPFYALRPTFLGWPARRAGNRQPSSTPWIPHAARVCSQGI